MDSQTGRRWREPGFPATGIRYRFSLTTTRYRTTSGSVGLIAVAAFDLKQQLPSRARPCDAPWTNDYAGAGKVWNSCAELPTVGGRRAVVRRFTNAREMYSFDSRTVLQVNVFATDAKGKQTSRSPALSQKRQEKLLRALEPWIEGL